MLRVMVTYTVKPEHVQANEALVRAVYAELHELARLGFWAAWGDDLAA